MTTVASGDLRNHTNEVLQRVADGDVVTITVNGKPVADLRPHTQHRREAMTRSEFLALLSSADPDPTLSDDLDWISEGDTDDLGGIH